MYVIRILDTAQYVLLEGNSVILTDFNSASKFESLTQIQDIKSELPPGLNYEIITLL